MINHPIPIDSLIWAMLHPKAGRLVSGHLRVGRKALEHASSLLAHSGGPLIPFVIPRSQLTGLRYALASFMETAPGQAEAWIESHAALAGMGYLRIRKNGETTFHEKAIDLKNPPWLMFRSRVIESRLRNADVQPMTATLAPDASGLLIQVRFSAARLGAWDECALQVLHDGSLRPPLATLLPRRDGRVVGETAEFCFQTTRPEQTLRLSALAEEGATLGFFGGPRYSPRALGAIRLQDVQDTPLNLSCAEVLSVLPWQDALAVGKGQVISIPEPAIQALGESMGWITPFWKVPVIQRSLAGRAIAPEHA